MAGLKAFRPRVRAELAGAVVVLLAVGVSAGCGAADPGDPPSPPSASRMPASPGSSSPASGPSDDTSQSPAAPPDATDSAAPEGLQELARAGATARDTVEGSTVISIERDDDGWEVELADTTGDEHDVTVSADGAEVRSGPRKDQQDAGDRDKNLSRVADAELDLVAAAEAARSEVGDARVDEVFLDSHRSSSGPTVWDVNLRGADGQEHEVVVDAGDGSVLDHEVDD